MNDHEDPGAVAPSAGGCKAADMTIPELVGKVYDTAPETERCRMLEYLMKPLGVLSLVAVCNGIFAKIWFRSGWHDLHIRPEDAQTVRGIDVTALVEYVQQANAETIDGLASLLTTSPMMVYSATAVMLVTMLVRRAQTRRIESGRTGDPTDSGSLPI
jgi:hypothetical protein